MSPYEVSRRKNAASVTVFQKRSLLHHRLIPNSQRVNPVSILPQILVVILSLTKEFGPQNQLVGLNGSRTMFFFFESWT